MLPFWQRHGLGEISFGLGSGELLRSTSLGEEKSLAVLLECLRLKLLLDLKLLLLDLKLLLHLHFWLLLLQLEQANVEELQKMKHDPQLLGLLDPLLLALQLLLKLGLQLLLMLLLLLK